MFFALNEIDICIFVDDTTPYIFYSNLKLVLEKIEHNSELVIDWFEMNYMKLDTDKCHLWLSGNKNEYMWAELDEDIVWESNDVELLGVKKDNNLIFNKNVSNICLKANRKLNALTRAAKFVLFKKNAFFLEHL